jgi:membrane-associated HD superfamily phosphohydrolase
VDPARRQLIMQRLVAAALVVLAVPPIVALASVAEEQPIRAGEPAPRTVFAEEAVLVTDPEATETARRTAWESVEPVLTPNREAQTAIVRDVREVFIATREVRQAPTTDTGAPGPVPGAAIQRTQLAALEPGLPEEVVAALVALTPSELDVVERETIAITQELARQRVVADDVESLLADTLPIELALRNLPGDTGAAIVVPVIEQYMRPTVVVDPDATSAARERASDSVE